MKTNLCDVCLSEGHKTFATIRVGYKGSMKLDVCKDHRKWNAEEKNKMEWEKKASEIRFAGEHFVITGILTTAKVVIVDKTQDALDDSAQIL